MDLAGKNCDRWFAEARPYEILTLAIRMEQGAARNYAAMARAMKNRTAQAKFRYLAEEEREHARILGAARNNLARPEPARKLPVALAEVTGTPDGDRPAQAVELALRAEREAEKFYRDCARRCARSAGRTIFIHLAEQEAGHARILNAELKALAGPLPWSSIEGSMPEEEDFWS